MCVFQYWNNGPQIEDLVSIFEQNTAKIQMYSEGSVICGGLFVDQTPIL